MINTLACNYRATGRASDALAGSGDWQQLQQRPGSVGGSVVVTRRRSCVRGVCKLLRHSPLLTDRAVRCVIDVAILSAANDARVRNE